MVFVSGHGMCPPPQHLFLLLVSREAISVSCCSGWDVLRSWCPDALLVCTCVRARSGSTHPQVVSEKLWECWKGRDI